ncbi:hypothetical protein EG329_001365 [Mollisiaceae sp. DMI_Dod_QoI]|nr:hypothetical protein EG329_001365 [Helotiales sp. DMI_Dod_QoI]
MSLSTLRNSKSTPQKTPPNHPALLPQVLEYLIKKGYNRTEHTLRMESAHVDKDGRPIHNQSEDHGFQKYSKSYTLIRDWAEGNLDVYKFECRRLLWPMFVYSYLELVLNDGSTESEKFFAAFSEPFEKVHADELRVLATIKVPQHVFDNSIAKLYRNNKYRIPLNTHVYFGLTTFLEQKDNTNEGGRLALYLIQTYCELRETQRGPLDQFSFDAIVNKSRNLNIDDLDLQEGIEGAFTGVSNKDIMDNTTQLKLGMMAMEPDLALDVRAELEDEDIKNPPPPGKSSLVEEFDHNIKREDSADGPTRTEVPLPPSRARDVLMEVQKIKESRDRFRIDTRTGGVGPGVSVCMFTFHNTLDSITCIEFSDDTKLVAVGTEESYIRVWHLAGDTLPSIIASNNTGPPTSSRRLVGHSAAVYSVSFSPSIDSPATSDPLVPSTAPKLLLSSSADKTVRLWSLESWTCLAVYKGHEGPVWNVRWGPHGHYFASCGWDKTVRVWSQDHISYLRMMVGHDTNVNQVAWHPNGAYIFSASDEADKTVRMWSFVTGECVRVFAGHTDFISDLECSPSGKILASADGTGSIILWDIAKGTQIKRCRGHGKGGIWSLSFSVESTVLVSGGADGTVRVWDIQVPTDPHQSGDGEVIGTGGAADATRITTATGSQSSAAAAAGGKKKGKDTTITPDQISAFPTKKSPVYKVKFTRYVKDLSPSQPYVSLWDIEKLKTGLNPNPTQLNIDTPDLASPTPLPLFQIQEAAIPPHNNAPSALGGCPATGLSSATSQSSAATSRLDSCTLSVGSESSLEPYSSEETDISPADSSTTAESASPGHHRCDICRNQFPKRHLLNKHKRTSHDKPYKCPSFTCAYHTTGFGKRNDLGRHKKTTHKEYFQTISYLCSHMSCPHAVISFSRHDNCKRHIEQQHPKFPYLPPRISRAPQ